MLVTLMPVLLCYGAVAIFPGVFQEPLFTIPVNLWTGVHLLMTHVLLHVYPGLSEAEYWGLIVGWELLEQLAIPRVLCDHFRETWGDVVGDLLAAVPASLWL